jgi:hypothetical protein
MIAQKSATSATSLSANGLAGNIKSNIIVIAATRFRFHAAAPKRNETGTETATVQRQPQ